MRHRQRGKSGQGWEEVTDVREATDGTRGHRWRKKRGHRWDERPQMEKKKRPQMGREATDGEEKEATDGEGNWPQMDTDEHGSEKRIKMTNEGPSLTDDRLETRSPY
jgi:hypothetical protein